MAENPGAPTHTRASPGSAVAAAADELAGHPRVTRSAFRIGAAVGVLMTRRDVPFEFAFDLLQRSGRYHGMEIRDIAEHVLATGELPPP